jgi:predicted CopG family antitoxin
MWNRRKNYLLTIFTVLFMLATKRIPVTETVWVELSNLKEAGQTYSQLLEEMIEDRKKARFFRDMEGIERESEFVELPW